jgi:hypothetical protein
MISKLLFGLASVVSRESTLEDIRGSEYSYTAPIVAGFFPDGCRSAVKRLKEGPEPWTDVINAGQLYEDKSYRRKDMLYSKPYDSLWSRIVYDFKLFFGMTKFARLGAAFPDNTMWGTEVDFTDPIQLQEGDSKVLNGLTAVAEYPQVIKNLFLTQSKNTAGIYAFKFYIRGKPWIVTIDDEVLLKKDGSGYYTAIGDNLWVPLLHKAWSKVIGTYLRDIQDPRSIMRAFTGAPTFYYTMVLEITDGPAFEHSFIKAADDLNYIIAASIFMYGDEGVIKDNGLGAGQIYSVLSAFELKTGSTVDHKMYMLRSQTGETGYNGAWNHADSAWTSSYIS